LIERHVGLLRLVDTSGKGRLLMRKSSRNIEEECAYFT
jgi:hypothetical protein